jgi:TonB-dependent SusC/RagA subfamily outer membrane receptor
MSCTILRTHRHVLLHLRVQSSLILLGAALAACPLPLNAQQQMGTVTGHVVEAGTATALPSVQIYLVDAKIGTLSGADGRFVLRGVAAGTHEVRAQRIGYKTATRMVTVRAGAATDVAFQVEQQVLALDEIVVTGTAGQAKRREVGNTITRIDVARIEKPIVSVDHLLQASSPGLQVSMGSGTLGGGSQIRLRGNVSVAMSNQPLMYVDGIRIRSDGYPESRPTASSSSERNAGTASPLDDINPDDIERVEVIKGPAATTLYGTEAAAGVIQIFTKRGAAGRPLWTVRVTEGANWLRPFGPDRAPIYPSESAYHLDGYYGMKPFLKTAPQQTYEMSVAGGTTSAQYFVSGAADNNKGVQPNDLQHRYRIRGNISFQPTSKTTVQWSTSLSNNNYNNTPGGNNAFGLTANVYRAPNNFIGGVGPIPDVLLFRLNNVDSHLITGGALNWQVTSALSQKVTVGYDRAETHQSQVIPFGTSYLPGGSIFDKRWQAEAITLEYVGNLDLKFGRDLTSKISWGGQQVQNHVGYLEGYGTNFPGPGNYTVSGASQKLTFAGDTSVINAGFFFQDLWGYKSKYFLTAGLRVDGNSAFGQNLGLQAYPKASFSYVLSDEPFWPKTLGTLKLRGAYGHAGRAPGAFDAVRTWSPDAFGNRSVFLPQNVGNPDLGPERTAEIEVGLEGTILGDRVTYDFTTYRRHTTNALFRVVQIPSLGFINTQLANVGEIQTHGIELALDGTPLKHGSWRLDIGTTFSTNVGKVLTLGGAPSFSLGSQGFIDVNQPLPVIRGTQITNPDELAEPILAANHNFGPNLPTITIGPHMTIGLPYGIQLSARGDYNAGNFMFDTQSRRMQISAATWPYCDRAREYLTTGRRAELTARERGLCDSKLASVDMFIWPGDYFRVRELAVVIPVNHLIPRASSASFTAGVRNFLTWKNKNFLGIDPEMTGDAGLSDQVRLIGENIPNPASFSASLRVSF